MHSAMSHSLIILTLNVHFSVLRLIIIRLVWINRTPISHELLLGRRESDALTEGLILLLGTDYINKFPFSIMVIDEDEMTS